MITQNRTFLVFSASSRVRAEMCVKLSPFGRAIPIGCVEELEMSLPRTGWIFAEDDPETFPQVARALRDLRLAFPLIAFGAPEDPEDYMRALDAGAMRYLLYPSPPEAIERMIEAIAAEADAAAEMLETANQADILLSRLSDREMEVLINVCQGLSNKEIAIMLDISPRTVEIHRSSALKKLAVGNCYEAFHTIIDANRLHPDKIRCMPATKLIQTFPEQRERMLAV